MMRRIVRASHSANGNLPCTPAHLPPSYTTLQFWALCGVKWWGLVFIEHLAHICAVIQRTAWANLQMGHWERLKSLWVFGVSLWPLLFSVRGHIIHSIDKAQNQFSNYRERDYLKLWNNMLEIPKVDASDLEFLPLALLKKCQNKTNIMQKYFDDLSGSWGFNG